MRAYLTQFDPSVQAAQDGAICLKMQQRIEAARGNASLLSQLKQEAAELACDMTAAFDATEDSRVGRLDRTLALLRQRKLNSTDKLQAH
ncbi:MAG: hypothetical protein AAF978_06840 [Cyanobacteria bacterium P01_E01_bin.48]